MMQSAPLYHYNGVSRTLLQCVG